MNIITRGLGLRQSLILRGYGGILRWLKTLISNAFIKVILRRKGHISPLGKKDEHISPLGKERKHIHPTDGREH